MSFLRMQHMERWKTILSLGGGGDTPDISHEALCSHYHKIQSLPINSVEDMKRMSLSPGEHYSSSFPQVAVSSGSGAHTQRMLSADQRPAAWSDLLQQEGSEVSLRRKLSGFSSANGPGTHTPLLLRGWPLLPQLPCSQHCFVFHCRAAAEDSCLGFTCPSYLPLPGGAYPLLFRRLGLSNINDAIGNKSQTCPLWHPQPKDRDESKHASHFQRKCLLESDFWWV